MSPSDDKSSSRPAPEGAAQDFLAFCEAEFERRRNSGQDFDEASYREAIDLVVRKFQALEGERRL